MVLAALTMTMGNLIAIQQKNLKRLIAYSSIGQVGYMLITIAAIGYGDPQGGINATSGLLIHIIGYVASTLLFFTALTAAYNKTGRDDIDGLKGLAETQPFLALVITCSLFSFAGLPFFAGFATKLFMFQGATTSETMWVVALAVLNSFISLYYYLMIIRQMYLYEPVGETARWKVNPVLGGLAVALVLAVLFIGMYPGPAFTVSEEAAKPLFEPGVATGMARVP
ncbi:MAG TPA: proton-conducting transporter membrane subunit, partial [Tepidiformaceae bacterium]|nr:proton-conducting transporter membrane subunit [Tepidiformaceae bacterium]